MEIQEKISLLMQQVIQESETNMGTELVSKAKKHYKDDYEGYMKWLNYCSMIRSFKPEIQDDEFNPEKFDATQAELKKHRS